MPNQRNITTERVVAPEPPRGNPSGYHTPPPLPDPDHACQWLDFNEFRQWMVKTKDAMDTLSTQVDRLRLEFRHEQEARKRWSDIFTKIGMAVVLGVVGALMGLLFTKAPQGGMVP